MSQADLFAHLVLIKALAQSDGHQMLAQHIQCASGRYSGLYLASFQCTTSSGDLDQFERIGGYTQYARNRPRPVPAAPGAL